MALTNLTPLTRDIADVMPGVVVRELADDVESLDGSIVNQVRENNREAWRVPSEAHRAE